MFELCYSSGLRLAELAGMKPEDLSLSDGTARVTGKGGKTRIVPVGSKAIQAVGEWIKQREGLVQPGATLCSCPDTEKTSAGGQLPNALKIKLCGKV